jgi:hypothetical protein
MDEHLEVTDRDGSLAPYLTFIYFFSFKNFYSCILSPHLLLPIIWSKEILSEWNEHHTPGLPTERNLDSLWWFFHKSREISRCLHRLRTGHSRLRSNAHHYKVNEEYLDSFVINRPMLPIWLRGSRRQPVRVTVLSVTQQLENKAPTSPRKQHNYS